VIGGGIGEGAFGLSLNLFESAGAGAPTSARAEATGGGTLVGATAAGAGGGESETKSGGGTGGVTKGAGPGAVTWGFAMVGGWMTAGTGSETWGAGDEALMPVGALLVSAIFGLKRIFGAAGTSATSGLSGAPVEITGGGGGKDVGSPAAGAAAGASPSAGRRRGFSRRAGGGVAGCSLIVADKSCYTGQRETKKVSLAVNAPSRHV
jgi:hypothetical protein